MRRKKNNLNMSRKGRGKINYVPPASLGAYIRASNRGDRGRKIKKFWIKIRMDQIIEKNKRREISKQ